MAKLLTDVELRAHWLASGADRIDIEEGTILSPAARDYIREQGIEIRWI
jgi:ethanolamine utilization cobalamin adenosyltransferase